MISGSAGAKYYDLQYEGNNKYKELFEKEFARQSSVSIFQVGIDGLKLITIGTSGQTLDEVTLPAKRSPHPASGFAKESYLDSVKSVSYTHLDVYKRQESIYYRDEDGLYVNLFIASTLEWPERGLALQQLSLIHI